MTQYTNLATNPQFDAITHEAGHRALPGNTWPRGTKAYDPLWIDASYRTEDGVGSFLRCTITKVTEDSRIVSVTPSPQKAGVPYTLLMKMRASGPLQQVRLRIGPADHVTVPLTKDWKYVKSTLTLSSPNDYTGFDLLPTGAQLGDTVDVASVCLVEGTYDGPHFDGSLTNGVWTGEPHNSPSTRLEEPASREVCRPRESYAVRDVKALGATGNGSNDDTKIIKKALDVGDGFGTVYFPAGTYKITEQLTWDPHRVELRGNGATLLFTQPATGSGKDDVASYSVKVVSSSPFPDGSPIFNRRMRHSGITFATTVSGRNGLWFAGETGSGEYAHYFEGGRRKTAHLTLSDMTFSGFSVATRVGSYAYMMGFRNCAFTSNTTTSYLPASVPGRKEEDRGERIFFESCTFDKNSTSPAIQMDGDQEYKFINCVFRDVKRLAHAGPVSKLDFVGCTIETDTASLAQGQACFTLADEAVISLNRSTLTVTASAGQASPIPALFAGSHKAQVNLESSTLKVAGVTTIADPNVRVLTSNLTVPTGSAVLPLSTGEGHTQMRYGVMAAHQGDWTVTPGAYTTEGASTEPPVVDINSLTYTPGTANGTILVTSIVSPGSRFVAASFDLLTLDNAQASTITSTKITLLNKAGAILGTATRAEAFTTGTGTAAKTLTFGMALTETQAATLNSVSVELKLTQKSAAARLKFTNAVVNSYS